MLNCSDSDDYDILDTMRPMCLPGGSIRVALIVNMAAVMALGVPGNILTLVALPYVKIKYRNEFSVMQITPALYLIFHLSLCDLLYCVIGFPHFIQVYYLGYFPYSASFCKCLGMIRNIIAYTDFCTMGVISVCVCTKTTNSKLHDKIFGGCRIIIVCLFIWVAGFICVCSDVFGITGSYGWTANVYGCDAVVSEDKLDHKDIGGLNHYLGVLVNLLVILISYSLLAIKILKDRRLAKKGGDIPIVIEKMDQIMKTLMFLTLSYAVFLIPSLLTSWTKSVKPISEDSRIQAGVTSLYFWLYGANFIIYVATSQRLRDAYRKFLSDLFGCLFSSRDPAFSPMAIPSTHAWWSKMRYSAKEVSKIVTNNETNEPRMNYQSLAERNDETNESIKNEPSSCNTLYCTKL